jgi:hypothetical protein
LIGLVVQQQMVIAKVRAAHVPVEILSLDVEDEGVRQQSTQYGPDLFYAAGINAGVVIFYCSVCLVA